MKPGAAALSVVLLVAGCSAYEGATAKDEVGTRPATGRPAVHQPSTRDDTPTAVRPPTRLPAAAVLHAWDRRRAHAWATGDTEALRRLYVPGSAAGRADLARLRAYLHRGLRVAGMRMQIFTVLVMHHSRRRWRLRVTDRLARAIAVGHGSRVRLPRDVPVTRLITLVRGHGGRWRVASVEPTGH